jgi:ribosome modulation factor
VAGATPTPTPSATPTPVDLSAYELPASARRSLTQVGATAAGNAGLSVDAFGTARGQMIGTLMRRLDAPLPSRWLSIALRRALMAQVGTPEGINGADFAAQRAWLLLRMGEADGARAVVQSVDVQDYSPQLFQIAMQAMLATGDPAGLCPLVEPASRVSWEGGWRFARAMCAALGGKGPQSKALLREARRNRQRSIDTLLAEKVVGAAAGGAVTIEWGGVDRLTAWRYGLATATGVEIPAELLDGARPQVRGWRATAPMLDAATRLGSADWAASQGVLSHAALMSLYAEVEAGDDANSAVGALGRDLRSSYGDAKPEERLRLLRQIWDGGEGSRARYARQVLTARAATFVAPSNEAAADAPRLIASMLTAGYDTTAARWWGAVPAATDGWAMLALADPSARRLSSGDVDGYADADSDPQRLKARMLLAGLTGLGRLPFADAEQLAPALDVRFGAENAWTRAIAAAADRNEGGTVLLLTAVGMQTPSWRGVPPEVLFHACRALRATGQEGVARMIAAEAIARV